MTCKIIILCGSSRFCDIMAVLSEPEILKKFLACVREEPTPEKPDKLDALDKRLDESADRREKMIRDLELPQISQPVSPHTSHLGAGLIGHIITRRDNPTLEASKQATGGGAVKVYTEAAANYWLEKGFIPGDVAKYCVEPVRLTLIRTEIEHDKAEQQKAQQRYPEPGCNQGCGICHETEERSAEEICNAEPAGDVDHQGDP